MACQREVPYNRVQSNIYSDPLSALSRPEGFPAIPSCAVSFSRFLILSSCIDVRSGTGFVMVQLVGTG